MSNATTTTERLGRGVALHLRWHVKADLTRLVALDSVCHQHPWTAQDFCDCVRDPAVVCKVAEAAGQIRGFMVYEICRDRLNLLNIAVQPSWQRYGIGRRLVNDLIARLQPARCNRLNATVWERNVGAQLFLRSCGLKVIAIERKCFEGVADDGYVFERRVI